LFFLVFVLLKNFLFNLIKLLSWYFRSLSPIATLCFCYIAQIGSYLTGLKCRCSSFAEKLFLVDFIKCIVRIEKKISMGFSTILDGFITLLNLIRNDLRLKTNHSTIIFLIICFIFSYCKYLFN